MNCNHTETIDLIAQIRSGNRQAWSRLAERELPPLRKYARGRLPACARGATDTQDLIQDVFARTLPRLATWRSEGPGALRAFLRKAVANQIVDEVRKARRRRGSPAALESLVDRAPSPLANIVRQENVTKLQAALAKISDSDRQLLVARFGSDCRYAEIAARLGRPSANAVRVAVERAIDRVAQIMERNERKAASVLEKRLQP
jgi:RNA polymerase sigma factor (sigma-70 family)